jgi:hypothetical protein
MGRHYRIEITPGSSTPSSTNAYQVDFDLTWNSDGTLGGGNRLLKIYGIDPRCISQVTNLNFANITIYGGFDNGMPLSTLMAPLSTQPLLVGQIFQPWGNWVGTELYLALPIISTGNYSSKPNLVYQGAQGMPLSTVITQAMQTAFPATQVVVDVSTNLVLPQQEQQPCVSLEDFANIVRTRSISYLSAALPNYTGVMMGWKGSQLIFTDKIQPTGSKTVDIQSWQLIGNPVWTSLTSLQVMCPMRSDISIFDNVTLPNIQAVQTSTGPQAVTQNNNQITGTYQVINLRHLGSFRSSDATTWATIYDLFPTPVTSTNANSQTGATTGSISATTGSGAPVAFGS